MNGLNTFLFYLAYFPTGPNSTDTKIFARGKSIGVKVENENLFRGKSCTKPDVLDAPSQLSFVESST